MGAALAIAAAAPQSGARGGAAIGGTQKPASGPKNPLQIETTQRRGISGRALLTADDLRAAIAWRIDGIPATEIEAIAAALRPFADDFREARPEIAAVLADLRRPGDRRDAWGLACAVLADDAARRRDLSGFWSAGFVVAEAARQGRRMPTDRSPLTEPMRRFRQDHPGCSPSKAFEVFRAGGCDVVTGYLSRDDALQVVGWSMVTRESFIRQYNRL